MAWYDRIIGRKPVRKISALEEMIANDTNQIMKEARTPVYSAMGTNAQYQESILPPIDQRYLEQLADRYSHLRTVISRIASQSVAKGWEYHAVGDTGDKEERKILETLLRDPTRGDADISGMELFKAMIRQLEIFDDVWVSIVYDRVEGGQMKVVKQLWVEDAKHMRFHVDEYGRFKNDVYFDVITRQFVDKDEKTEGGIPAAKMAYFYDQGGDSDKIPFARDEIIHFNKYSATARLYGQSPIMGLSKKIETALAIENFQNKIYKLERPPKGFLDIPGHDEESLNRLGEYIAEETRRNPNFVPIISSRGEGTGSGQAKFVPVMPNMDELMALPYMERINNDINAAYGVMPIITGSTAGVGGLNAEGEQVSIFDRTILETQKCIEMGFFKPLLKILGIQTWKIRFADINVKNEQQQLANMLQKANIITVLNKVGIEATLDKDGNLKLPDNPQISMPDDAKPEVGALKP
tara:strand:- start:647 stop:2047 length:1401 start_codon:yes stop_codon:yes gene_type:complete